MKKHSIRAILLSSAVSLSLLISAFGINGSVFAASGVPTAPNNIRISSVGDGTATIGFDSVTSVAGQFTFDPNANLVTDGYIVTLHSSKGDVSYPPTGLTSVVIPNLQNDVTYTATVAAKNDKGTGPSSLSSLPFTPKPTPASATNGIQTNLNLAFHLDNPISGDGDLLGFVQTILKAVVLLLTPVIVLMMLYAGFMFVTAQGNGEKLIEAKNALVYTMIGAAIVLGAEGFATIIKSTVNCLAGGTGC